MKRKWYEKYIGYCFNDNGKEVVLIDILEYEDGRRYYALSEKQPDGTYKDFITDYAVFKMIARQTALPRK